MTNQTHPLRTHPLRSALACVSAGVLLTTLVWAAPSIAAEDNPPGSIGDSRKTGDRLIAYTTPVGAAEVNAGRIRPYTARWNTRAGIIEETLAAVDDAVWRHTQTTTVSKDGESIKVVTEVRELSRQDLRSLSWSRTNHIEVPQLPFKDVSVVVRSDGIFGSMTDTNGETQPYDAPLPMPVFDGWIAGLAIAALPLSEGYWASLPTGTYLFRGTHHLTVRVVGRSEVAIEDGGKIDTWEVEADWVDLGSGDIYEPGADGDGGVYFIAVNPGEGVPYVVQYLAKQAQITWDGVRRHPGD